MWVTYQRDSGPLLDSQGMCVSGNTADWAKACSPRPEVTSTCSTKKRPCCPRSSIRPTALSGFRTAARWPGPNTAVRVGCPAFSSPTSGRPGWHQPGCCTTPLCPPRSGCWRWTGPAPARPTRSVWAAGKTPPRICAGWSTLSRSDELPSSASGRAIDDVFAFAARYPRLVASVSAVSARLSEPVPGRRSLMHPFADRSPRTAGGVLGSWLGAIGNGADLTKESSWAKGVSRMTGDAEAALGDRWHEAGLPRRGGH